jgi:hypothetical protein
MWICTFHKIGRTKRNNNIKLRKHIIVYFVMQDAHPKVSKLCCLLYKFFWFNISIKLTSFFQCKKLPVLIYQFQTRTKRCISTEIMAIRICQKTRQNCFSKKIKYLICSLLVIFALLLRSVYCLLATEVSGQLISSILTLEDGIDRLSRIIGNYQYTLRNIPEQ